MAAPRGGERAGRRRGRPGRSGRAAAAPRAWLVGSSAAARGERRARPPAGRCRRARGARGECVPARTPRRRRARATARATAPATPVAGPGHGPAHRAPRGAGPSRPASTRDPVRRGLVGQVEGDDDRQAEVAAGEDERQVAGDVAGVDDDEDRVRARPPAAPVQKGVPATGWSVSEPVPGRSTRSGPAGPRAGPRAPRGRPSCRARSSSRRSGRSRGPGTSTCRRSAGRRGRRPGRPARRACRRA